MAVGRALAQPVAPWPVPAHALRAADVAALATTSTAFTVNPASREEVRQFYRAVYFASQGVAMGWTGSYASGTAGDTSADFKEATRVRINFYRALAGVPSAITLNPAYSTPDQQAALMMSGNNTLQHTGIPTSWLYYTADGANAAGNSNLALGQAGPDAIDGYIADAGANNGSAGHRRWLFYPQTQQMGTGDVPGDASHNSANATWVIDANYGTARPATRTTQVAYPPAGYVPYQLVWPRWSFSYPGADFTSATVTMTRGGQAIATTPEAQVTNEGEPTLVWVYNNLDATQATPHPKPAQDTTYAVNVANVMINGAAQNFTYNVTVFDPDVAGSDAATVTVSGSSAPVVGQANSYSVALPSFASSFDWRTLQVASYSKTYGAETGLDGITAATSSGYPVVQTDVVASGTSAFHLAQPTPTDQILTLPETFYVANSTASVTFLSELATATSTQFAHVQVSPDDGASWSDIYTQAGMGLNGEGIFLARSAPLSAYVGQTVRVRFVYTLNGTYYFPETDPGVGWYLDNIAVNGVQAATVGVTTHVASGTSFAFAPSSAGPVSLQARGVMFGAYPLAWGPPLVVTAGSSPPPTTNTTYLSNLSVRTTAGSGAQTLIVGFATTGTKRVVIRGVGPTLANFGVPGVLADPKLDLYSGQTVILSDDDWNAADAPTFSAVGAFDLLPNSKDAALVTTLNGGTYTAQVSGANGATGVALVELYDASGVANGARLTNASARAQVGTGAGILIAGFNVVGTGQRSLLIRGVGGGLSQFGVTGVLADPKLEIFSGQTKIYQNDDWDPSLQSAFDSVHAFMPVTKDAALVVSLPAGSYTAQVSGVGDTTGVALVEVYELP